MFTDVLSTTMSVPGTVLFPVGWRERNVAWTSSGDLYFVDRADKEGGFRLVHYRVLEQKSHVLAATQTVSRLSDLYLSPDGKTLAYLESASTTSPETKNFRLRALDVATSNTSIVRDLGPLNFVELGGWTRDPAGLVIGQPRAADDSFATWTIELHVIARDGTVRQRIEVDHVPRSRLLARKADVYFTRSPNGIGNLFAISIAALKPQPVSTNSVLDVTFGSAEPFGEHNIIGIRHKVTKDIYLIDARRQVKSNSGVR